MLLTAAAPIAVWTGADFIEAYPDTFDVVMWVLFDERTEGFPDVEFDTEDALWDMFMTLYMEHPEIQCIFVLDVVLALSSNSLDNYWTSSGPYDEIFYYIRLPKHRKKCCGRHLPVIQVQWSRYWNWRMIGHTDILCTEEHYDRNRRNIDKKSEIISSIPEFNAK